MLLFVERERKNVIHRWRALKKAVLLFAPNKLYANLGLTVVLLKNGPKCPKLYGYFVDETRFR